MRGLLLAAGVLFLMFKSKKPAAAPYGPTYGPALAPHGAPCTGDALCATGICMNGRCATQAEWDAP
jgi:hypothetical protein